MIRGLIFGLLKTGSHFAELRLLVITDFEIGIINENLIYTNNQF